MCVWFLVSGVAKSRCIRFSIVVVVLFLVRGEPAFLPIRHKHNNVLLVYFGAVRICVGTGVLWRKMWMEVFWMHCQSRSGADTKDGIL